MKRLLCFALLLIPLTMAAQERYLVTAKTQVVREGLGTYQAGIDEAFLPLKRAGSIQKNLEIRIGNETIQLPLTVQVLLQKKDEGLDLWVRAEARPSTMQEPHRVERHLGYNTEGGSRVMTLIGDPERKYAVHLVFDVRPEEVEEDLFEKYRPPTLELIPLHLRLTRLRGSLQDVVDEIPLNAAINDGAMHHFQRQVAVAKRRAPAKGPESREGGPEVIQAGEDGTFQLPAGQSVTLDLTGSAAPGEDGKPRSLYERRKLKEEQERLEELRRQNPDLTEDAAAKPYLGMLADSGESYDADGGEVEVLTEYIRINVTPENRLAENAVLCRVDLELHLVGRRGFLTVLPQQRTFRLTLEPGKSETLVMTEGEGSARTGYRVEVALPDENGNGLSPGDAPASSSWFAKALN